MKNIKNLNQQAELEEFSFPRFFEEFDEVLERAEARSKELGVLGS